MKPTTLKQMVELAESQSTTIARAMAQVEAQELGVDASVVRLEMARRITILKEAALHGTQEPVTSKSGLIRGGAFLMAKSLESGRTIVGGLFSKVVANAMAVAEVNACMGRIVAAPTAGSCGVIPGTLLIVAQELGLSDDVVIDGFLTAGAIGVAIEKQATLAGAEGGCQAECGAASAMAAGALVEMMGDSPRRVANAVAFALKSVLGLICDPVAGLVEIPCVKRNVMGAVNALAAAEMAMAGIETVIPADEVIVAMGEVGKRLPIELRETGKGGTADTPTAKSIKGTI